MELLPFIVLFFTFYLFTSTVNPPMVMRLGSNGITGYVCIRGSLITFLFTRFRWAIGL